MYEFLLDENVLGTDRYLEGHVKYRKVGDGDCPKKAEGDPAIVNFAQKHNLIIVTNDDKMTKQCKLINVEYIKLDLIVDLAEKVKNYSNSD